MVIDWTNLFKRYKGKWVALKSDERSVIGSGKTAKQAWKMAVQSGYTKPILTRMPAKLVTYIGFGV